MSNQCRNGCNTCNVEILQETQKESLSRNAAPVTAIIVGAGHRSIICGSYGLKHPEELKIVGVVEPNKLRREKTAEMFDIPLEHCFSSVEEQ